MISFTQGELGFADGFPHRKTHIEIAYAYYFGHESPHAKIHYVNAGTAEQFEQSFKAIKSSLRLPNTRKDAVESVYRYLKQESDDRWLLILDGLRDEADLTATNPAHGGRSLLDFVPASDNGRVLMSTQSKAFANRLVDHRDQCVLDILPLSGADAAQLLLNGVTQEEGKLRSADLIVKELGNSPVALTLAYTHRHYIDRMTTSQYLEMLNSQPETTAPKDIAGVYRAWLPLYNHLYRAHQEAARLLLLIGTLDLQTVPSQFTTRAVESRSERHIKTLERYCMVEPSMSRTATGMTALIRQCVQFWLVDHNQKSVYEEQALSYMRQAIYENKGVYRPVLHPCALAVLSFPINLKATRDRADLLFKVGRYYIEQGAHISAIPHLEECLSLRQKDSPTAQALIQETMTALNQAKQSHEPDYRGGASLLQHQNHHHARNLPPRSLQSIYHQPSNALEAPPLVSYQHRPPIPSERRLATSVDAQHPLRPPTSQPPHLVSHSPASSQSHHSPHLGNASLPTPPPPSHHLDHATWLTPYNKAIALSKAGREQTNYSQALNLYLTALRAALPLLGPAHQVTLQILSGVAVTKHLLGHSEEGREILKAVLTQQEALLGPEHPDTVKTRHNASLMMMMMMQSTKRMTLPDATRRVGTGTKMIGGVRRVREVFEVV